jgi:hypothetical protein
MAPRRATLWELEGHSEAKPEILRRYVGGWLPIMAQWNGRLLVLDGFAGPGRVAGGEEGSPPPAGRLLLASVAGALSANSSGRRRPAPRERTR